MRTRSSSKAGRGNAVSESTASGATAKSQDKEPKETTTQERYASIDFIGPGYTKRVDPSLTHF